MPSDAPAKARAEEEGRRPAPRLAATNEAVALGDAAEEREHQRERELGGRLLEDARRGRDEDAALGRRLDVHVVDSGRVVRDHPKLRPGSVEKLGVDVVRQHGHEALASGDGAEELVAGRRRLGVVDPNIEARFERSADGLRNTAGDEDPRAHGREAYGARQLGTPRAHTRCIRDTHARLSELRSP